MSDRPRVRVELFGMARLLAGEPTVDMPWEPGLTVADVPAQLAAACPALRSRAVDDEGRLAAGYVFNLNGRSFVRDPATPIRLGDRLLLLGADPGG